MDELISMMNRVSILSSDSEFNDNYRFAITKLRFDHSKAEAFAINAIKDEQELDRERMRRMALARDSATRKRLMEQYVQRKKARMTDEDELSNLIMRLSVSV